MGGAVGRWLAHLAGGVALGEDGGERRNEEAVQRRAEHERDEEGVELGDGVGSVSDAKRDGKDLSDLCGRNAPRDDTLTIRPPPRAIIFRLAQKLRLPAAVRLVVTMRCQLCCQVA